jgi:hypothetical protein
MTPVSFFIKEGCALTKPSEDILRGIYSMTNGDPCKGCGMKPCPVDNKIKKTKILDGRKIASMKSTLLTNAELAKKHNVTKRFISKNRVPGTNKVGGILKEEEVL